MSAALDLPAPVVIVTPRGLGVAGADSPSLVAGIELPRGAQGDDLARAAMVAVRRLARAGGRPLPAHVPAAEAIGPALVGRDARGGDPVVDGWLVAAVLALLPLLGGLVYVARKLPKHPSLES